MADNFPNNGHIQQYGYVIGKVMAGLVMVHSLRLVENQTGEKHYTELAPLGSSNHIAIRLEYNEAIAMLNKEKEERKDNPRYRHVYYCEANEVIEIF
jgi:hypothetical protein